MENKNHIHNQRKINVRFIFGIVFPILLSLIPLGISVSGYNLLQKKQVEMLSKRWVEKAKLVLNDVRSCWSFEDYFYLASKKFIKLTNTNLKNNPLVCINKSFTKRMIENSQIWLFKKTKQRLQIVKGKPLQTTFSSAMRKIAETLICIKENSYSSRVKALNNIKFISGVFGNQSLPKYIAKQQEGILTPIKFKGENKYLLWLTTGKSEYCFIAIISPKLKIDLTFNLQKTANRIFKQYKKQIAVSFAPAKFANVDKQVILPQFIYNNTHFNKIYENLITSVNKDIEYSEKVPYEQRYDKNNHLFLESYITKNNPYNAIVFAPVPKTLRPNLISYTKTVLASLLVWFLILTSFYIRTKRIGLPLKLSFKFFFFIVGISAAAIIFLFGQNIINESYYLSLSELKRTSLQNLVTVDNDATLLVENYYSKLSTYIASRTYDALCSKGKAKHQSTFTNIRNEMIKSNLSLDYLIWVSPEHGSEYFHAPYAPKAKAIEFMDLFTSIMFSLQSIYDLGMPNSLQTPIKLTSKQKSIKNMFKNYGFNFVIDLTKNITESGGFFQLGTMSKTFFILLILQKADKRMAYTIFGINSYRLFKKYLVNKIANLNCKKTDQYAALLNSKDETLILPHQRNKIWQSVQGKNLLSFMRKSMKSSFPIYISDDKNLYITTPMTSNAHSICGAIISLASINNERKIKSLINLIFFIITSLITYIFASFITSYLVSPLSNINEALKKIYNGHLKTKLIKRRNDELGVLSDTINTMQKGLKDKQKLGKFVSSVFSEALSNSSIDQLKAGISFTGTILFSDIRGFTTMSEQHSPNIIATMLNTHLSNLAQSTHKYEGQVEQFIGDAIVSVFPDKDSSKGYERALKAAQEIMLQHNIVQTKRKQSGNFCYAIGIGLDHGQLIAGSLITDERAEFSVIGLPRTNAELNEAASKNGNYTKIIISKNIFEKLKHQNLFSSLPQHTHKYELKEFSDLL